MTLIRESHCCQAPSAALRALRAVGPSGLRAFWPSQKHVKRAPVAAKKREFRHILGAKQVVDY